MVDKIRGGQYTDEETNLYLMREIYHCPPSVFEQQDYATVQLHIAMLQEQQRQEKIKQKRQEQRQNLKS